MTRHGIVLDESRIRDFCRKWHIEELFVFGSFLREDFRPDSDIDFMFTLDSGTDLPFSDWLKMEDELSHLVGRKVELVPRTGVEESENYIRRKHILSTAEPIYAKG